MHACVHLCVCVCVCACMHSLKDLACCFQSWEFGVPLCKELAELYESKIQYSKLCEILVSSLAYRFTGLGIFTNITLN